MADSPDDIIASIQDPSQPAARCYIEILLVIMIVLVAFNGKSIQAGGKSGDARAALERREK